MEPSVANFVRVLEGVCSHLRYVFYFPLWGSRKRPAVGSVCHKIAVVLEKGFH